MIEVDEIGVHGFVEHDEGRDLVISMVPRKKGKEFVWDVLQQEMLPINHELAKDYLGVMSGVMAFVHRERFKDHFNRKR